MGFGASTANRPRVHANTTICSLQRVKNRPFRLYCQRDGEAAFPITTETQALIGRTPRPGLINMEWIDVECIDRRNWLQCVVHRAGSWPEVLRLLSRTPVQGAADESDDKGVLSRRAPCAQSGVNDRPPAQGAQRPYPPLGAGLFARLSLDLHVFDRHRDERNARPSSTLCRGVCALRPQSGCARAIGCRRFV